MPSIAIVKVVTVVQGALTHTRAQTILQNALLSAQSGTKHIIAVPLCNHSAKRGGREAGLTCTSKSGPVGALMVPSTSVKVPSIELLLCKLRIQLWYTKGVPPARQPDDEASLCMKYHTVEVNTEDPLFCTGFWLPLPWC